MTVAPYFIVINFHVSRFGLNVIPAACIRDWPPLIPRLLDALNTL